MKKTKVYLFLVFLLATVFFLREANIQNNNIGANARSSDSAQESFSALSGAKEEFSGTLNIFIEDKIEKGKPRESIKYFIYGDREVLEFIPVNLSSIDNGSVVTVSGFRKDGKFFGEIIKKKNINKKIFSGQTPVVKKDQKVAVFLVNFLDSGNTPFDVTQAQNVYFGGNQMQNFYKEQSFGKMNFSGKVFDWITLPRNSDNSCGAYLGNGAELDPYISALNINLNDYDHVLFNFDCKTEVLGNLWGMATVGKINYFIGNSLINTSVIYTAYSDNFPNRYNDNATWSSYGTPFNFSWTNFDSLVSHEMGHALGVLHANTLECGAQTLSTNCFNIDYGNFLDVMGWQQGFGFHTNAYYKEAMGFINNSNSINISQSGTYTIGLLNSNASTVKSAKIKIAGTNIYPYYLEFRKALGFDEGLNDPTTISNQNGLLVNRVVRYPNTFVSGYMGPSILDMTPNSLNVLDREYSLNGSSTFYDSKSGITIGPIISQTNTSITFDVSVATLPACVNQPLIVNPMANPNIFVGQSAQIIFGIFNNDNLNCNPSKFAVVVIPPTNWPNAPFNPTNPNFPPSIDPGQIIAISAGNIVSPNVLPGIYNYTIQVDNLTTGVSSIYLYPIQVN